MYGLNKQGFMVIVTKSVVPVLLVVLTFLLFVGGPEHYSSRVYRDIWDLGHIPLFIVLTILLYRLPFIEHRKWFVQVAIVFSLAMFFAVLSEWLQSGVDRTAELVDVRRDFVGAFIGTLIVFRKSYGPRKIFPVLVAAALVLCVFEINPLAKTIIDEYNIYKAGAVLSNLESVFEDERWRGNSEYTLSAEFVDEGAKSLKVVFNTDSYSGITLKYMCRDWRGKNSLYASVFNPEENSLLINIRINDFLHIKIIVTMTGLTGKSFWSKVGIILTFQSTILKARQRGERHILKICNLSECLL